MESRSSSAVTSFALGDVHVNLIDTPGHPDFIAEVERVLSVLDGAVLVISAVEGVQPQTRILMRALQRLRIPTLAVREQDDRAGAGEDGVLRAISRNARGLRSSRVGPRMGWAREDARSSPSPADDTALHELLAQENQTSALLESSPSTTSRTSRRGRLLSWSRCPRHAGPSCIRCSSALGTDGRRRRRR